MSSVDAMTLNLVAIFISIISGTAYGIEKLLTPMNSEESVIRIENLLIEHKLCKVCKTVQKYISQFGFLPANIFEPLKIAYHDDVKNVQRLEALLNERRICERRIRVSLIISAIFTLASLYFNYLISSTLQIPTLLITFAYGLFSGAVGWEVIKSLLLINAIKKEYNEKMRYARAKLSDVILSEGMEVSLGGSPHEDTK